MPECQSMQIIVLTCQPNCLPLCSRHWRLHHWRHQWLHHWRHWWMHHWRHWRLPQWITDEIMLSVKLTLKSYSCNQAVLWNVTRGIHLFSQFFLSLILQYVLLFPSLELKAFMSPSNQGSAAIYGRHTARDSSSRRRTPGNLRPRVCRVSR